MPLDNVLSALRVMLLENAGSTQPAPGDSSKISIEIFVNTDHYVSKSTIMHIFGIEKNEQNRFWRQLPLVY